MIRIFATGGAGVNIANRCLKGINQLKEGFSEIKIINIDTSINNVDRFDIDTEDFLKIESDSYTSKDIAGSGIERATNVDEIVKQTAKFLDDLGINKKVVGEYNIVLSSAGGGSGGVISSMIVKNLLDRNIPVLPIIIGDSSDVLINKNTYKTLASLEQISELTDKPIFINYLENSRTMNGTNSDSMLKVDKEITRFVTVFSAFASGINVDIDHQDIYSIFHQEGNESEQIPSGLYSIKHIDTDSKPEQLIKSRTLKLNDEGKKLDLDCLSSKIGTAHPNVSEVFVKVNEIHLITESNTFGEIVEKLLSNIELGERMKAKLKTNSFKNNNFTSTGDTGLII